MPAPPLIDGTILELQEVSGSIHGFIITPSQGLPFSTDPPLEEFNIGGFRSSFGLFWGISTLLRLAGFEAGPV